jgi:large subunit ribosomal protein L27
MAHTKAGGSTRQKGNRRGKYLGVKISTGQKVGPGVILIRQKGATFKSGIGTKVGRDFTIYSAVSGIVSFKQKLGQKLVQVLA